MSVVIDINKSFQEHAALVENATAFVSAVLAQKGDPVKTDEILGKFVDSFYAKIQDEAQGISFVATMGYFGQGQDDQRWQAVGVYDGCIEVFNKAREAGLDGMGTIEKVMAQLGGMKFVVLSGAGISPQDFSKETAAQYGQTHLH